MNEWVAAGLAWLALIAFATTIGWLIICITEIRRDVAAIREMLENPETDAE